jgi:hypothetical protein
VTHISRGLRNLSAGVPALLLLAACHGEPIDPAAPTGALRITMQTLGATLDGDGYLYRVGDSTVTLAVQDSQEVAGLPSGPLGVQLEGLATNCRAFSPGPPSVTIDPSETAEVSLVVSCDSAFRNMILYEHWTAENRPEIWVMRPDGTGKERVVADAWFPAATPNGAQVIYQSFVNARLWIVRADRTKAHELVPALSGGQFDPDVSPDGRSVVFSRAPGAPPALYRVNLDGTDLVPLTTGGGDQEARWSPDGRFITFTRFGDTSQVLRLSLDGGDPVPLTTGAGGCCARWSPDGSRLLYFDFASSTLQTMAPDGSDVVSLSPAWFGTAYAEWSPDGREIAFEWVPDSLIQIWRAPVDRSGDAALTDDRQNTLGRWLR